MFSARRNNFLWKFSTEVGEDSNIGAVQLPAVALWQQLVGEGKGCSRVVAHLLRRRATSDKNRLTAWAQLWGCPVTAPIVVHNCPRRANLENFGEEFDRGMSNGYLGKIRNVVHSF
jgi:hypothetical protein